jgi:hypothetical protein
LRLEEFEAPFRTMLTCNSRQREFMKTYKNHHRGAKNQGSTRHKTIKHRVYKYLTNTSAFFNIKGTQRMLHETLNAQKWIPKSTHARQLPSKWARNGCQGQQKSRQASPKGLQDSQRVPGDLPGVILEPIWEQKWSSSVLKMSSTHTITYPGSNNTTVSNPHSDKNILSFKENNLPIGDKKRWSL